MAGAEWPVEKEGGDRWRNIDEKKFFGEPRETSATGHFTNRRLDFVFGINGTWRLNTFLFTRVKNRRANIERKCLITCLAVYKIYSKFQRRIVTH